MSLTFATNRSTDAQIAGHLHRCDAAFVPPLSTRVDIEQYSAKIGARAQRFEAWEGGELIGLVAAYCNDFGSKTAYITNVSVLPGRQGGGIAGRLLQRCLDDVAAKGFSRVQLEVGAENRGAARLYEKQGFVSAKRDGASQTMHLTIAENRDENKEGPMKPTRDYNAEIRDTADHQYAYSFDFDVMHPFMIRSFAPFFRRGSFLELGSFKGDFTRRFLEYFEDVTCVEASDVAIAEARSKVGDRVKFAHGLMEQVTLPSRYDNIVLTHVLEHIDDPVGVLRRINDEWLADDGRFFLVCPNANAASRQIAVKMGLLTHHSAVTAAEAAHGHHRTYSLDTLERDVTAAGLRVVHRSGVFFKALANFQWDRLLATDIVSREYLEGCYALGQHYPDLCSSIFLLCEKGRVG